MQAKTEFHKKTFTLTFYGIAKSMHLTGAKSMI